MIRTNIAVLGGGLSGLAAACALEEAHADYILFERRPELGGFTRTAKVGDFCFDYTGHFLHLARYSSPARVPYANLRDEDWMLIPRKACCYVANSMVTAPLQYHLGELPQDVLEKCAKSYDERLSEVRDTPRNFKEYLVHSFGRSVAELFLIPQNEKTLATSVDRLSVRAVRRFFPVADDAVIRRGMKKEPVQASSYNSFFWYPRTGGISALTEGFAKRVQGTRLNHEGCTVNLAKRELNLKDGTKVAWGALLTSVPLPQFCLMTEDPALVSATSELTHSATISVNIGVSGDVAPALAGLHWVYVPNPAIPFYRVGVYSNISQGVCASGHAALYAEVGVRPEKLSNLDLVEVENQVICALEDLGWVNRSRISCVVTHVLNCAYVHHTPGAEAVLPLINKRLSEANVFLIGRYGRWDYTSMEDSIDDGISTAKKLIL